LQNFRQLLSTVGIATLFVTCCAVGLVALSSNIIHASTDLRQEMISIAAVVLPVSAATWWIFRRLKRSGFSKREARAIAIAYAASGPFWFVLALVPGEISGAVVERFLGGFFILPTVFVGAVVTNAILSFSTSAFILWLMRRGDELSAEKSLDS
jgi:hypothetical protein